jgi:hypothetical protein
MSEKQDSVTIHRMQAMNRNVSRNDLIVQLVNFELIQLLEIRSEFLLYQYPI